MRQQRVKTHMATSQLGVAAPQLRLPVGAQRETGVAAASSVAPVLRDEARGSAGAMGAVLTVALGIDSITMANSC